MTETIRGPALLSREEISALVDELSQARREEADAEELPGLALAGSAGRRPRRILRRTLDRFAGEQARTLSSRFQRAIDVRLLDLDEWKPSELAEHLLPHERVVEFGADEHSETGLLMIARPLFFSWMRVAFGARCERRFDPLPDRPLTPIEDRFLLQIAEEIVTRIGALATPSTALAVRGLVEPRQVREARSPRRLVASFDLSGFEEIGRIRIALPRSLEPRRSDPGAKPDRFESALGDALLEMFVPITARLGTSDLFLSHLAALEVGSVIPLESDREGRVALTVGDVVRFYGVRGQLGTRLAVQLTKRSTVQKE